MRSFAGLVLAVGWFGVWLALVLGRPNWIESSAQSTHSVSAAIILLWPLALGLGAAMAVHAWRAGMVTRMASWPRGAAWRYAVERIARATLIAAAGAVAAWVTGAIVALCFGSSPSLSTAPESVIAIVGVAGCLAWGWVGGSLVKSYVAAAGLPVLGYLAIWLIPAYLPLDPVAFTGATYLIGTAAHLKPWAVVSYLALHSLSILAAGAALFLVLRDPAAGPGMRAGAGAVSLVGIAGALFIQVTGPGGVGQSPWQLSAASAWECHTLDNPASTACLPRDLRARTGEFLEAMNRADPKLRLLLDPDAKVLYAPAEVASHSVFVPMENDLSRLRERWAAQLSTFVILRLDAPEGDCLALETSNQMWIEIMEGRDVGDDTVVSVSREVAGCD